jgi:hypothetical protein
MFEQVPIFYNKTKAMPEYFYITIGLKSHCSLTTAGHFYYANI